MILGLDEDRGFGASQDQRCVSTYHGVAQFSRSNHSQAIFNPSLAGTSGSFQKTHNNLRKHFLAQPLPRSSYWIDFNSTAQTLYGHQQGVVKGYNPGHRGKKSYHPLVATEAHLRDALGGFLRPGNAHTAEGVIPLLHEVISLLPITQGLRVRADAGFYDEGFCRIELDGNGIEFAIVARMTQPVKNRVAGIKYHTVNRFVFHL